MKTILAALCFLSLLCAARAEQTISPIVLKNKSVFTASDARSPFWPIGWTKPKPKNATANGATATISPASFSLTSVTTGGGARFAILNGKVMQEGQRFGLQYGSQIYQISVKAIEDGEVVLSYDGGEIIVPLHRR
jgi:hypothetical protein